MRKSRRPRLGRSWHCHSHRRRLSLETLESRRVLAGAQVALVVSGFGGADFPPRVLDELANSGFSGIGDFGTNSLQAEWNGGTDPGAIPVFELGDVPTASFEIPAFDPDDFVEDIFNFDPGLFPSIGPVGPVEIPTGLPQIRFVDLGDPTTSESFVDRIVGQLSGFSDEDNIVLMGHSLGGDTVLRIARALEHVVEIDLLALFDPVGFIPASGEELAAGLAERTLSIPGFSFGGLGDLGAVNDFFPELDPFEILAGTLPVELPINDADEIPGFFELSSVEGSVPANVKYLYNRWQNNDFPPIDFPILPRELSGSGRSNVLSDFGLNIAEQDAQQTKDEFYIPCAEGSTDQEKALSCLALLAPQQIQLNPFSTTSITIPVPNLEPPFIPPTIDLDIDVPNGINQNWLHTNAQLHHDFPQNNQIQDEVIDILRAIRLAVPPDEFEANDSVNTATVLGSERTVILNDLTIHRNEENRGDDDVVLNENGSDDVDFFQITAHETGKLVINAHYPGRGTIASAGLRIRDADNNILAEEEQSGNLVIPVVTQEEYFVEVYTVNGSHFCYDLEIENYPAPIPSLVDLLPFDDTGMMDNDDVTADTDLDFNILVDLNDFEDMGIVLRDSLTDFGAGVELVVTHESGDTIVAQASRIGDSSLWTADFEADEDGLYYVSARVEIRDPAGIFGDGPFSKPIIVTRDTEQPDSSDPFLLASSDTGMSNADMVTNKMSPGFTGVAEENAKIRLYAMPAEETPTLETALFIGEGAANGIHPSGGQGTWEITAEPLADGKYDVFVVVIDLAGNASDVSAETPVKRIEIDTLSPNTPYLDLIAASDAGRHAEDNVTSVNELTFTMTTQDPFQDQHLLAKNYKYRLFVRPEAAADGVSGEELLLYDSAVDGEIPVENIMDGLTDLEFLERTLDVLPDGYHNFKLEVEDRAGNISHDFLLEVTIDTEPPQKSLGDANVLNDGLHADSDSGVAGQPELFADRITNDTTPSFWGHTEANVIIRAYVLGANDQLVQIGQTVSVALDGDDDDDPTGSQGFWELTSTISLDDPQLGFHTLGGVRTIFIEAEDQAGNFLPIIHNGHEGNHNGNVEEMPEMMLDIFLDTQGPVVHQIAITEFGDFDLFDPKPSQRPTPAVDSLDITFTDDPSRVADDFVYPAVNEILATSRGNYTLIGDATGHVFIQSIDFIDQTVAGQPARTTVRLHFAEPLPDDRFSFTISDRISDDAGNALDGAGTAAAPGGSGFLSGDGVPGGDFLARFTVDSRAELGVWAAGSVYVDTNGNFQFDPENPDTTNEDIAYVLGFTTDNIFAGNFVEGFDDDHNVDSEGEEHGGGVADGFDKLAAFGRVAGAWRWLIDTDNDGVPNLVVTDPEAVNGLPVAGNFDNNSVNGDEVGILADNGAWYLDTDHDFRVDTIIPTDLVGFPIVGDFDGDGDDDFGTWTDDLFRFDLNHDGLEDETFRFRFGFSGVLERPVSADFDNDGIDDLGLWVPDRGGAVPTELAEWYILVSDGTPIPGQFIEGIPVLGRIVPDRDGVAENIVDFTPIPFGDDIFATFGDDFALPVVGNFDPPLVGDPPPEYQSAVFTNPVDHRDVNEDGLVTPVDVLWIINELNRGGSQELENFRTEAQPTGPYFDVNHDYHMTSGDALVVINYLNTGAVAEGEGEGDGGSADAVAVATISTSAAAAERVELWLAHDSQSLAENGVTTEQSKEAAPARAGTATDLDRYYHALGAQPDDTTQETVDAADQEAWEELFEALAEDQPPGTPL